LRFKSKAAIVILLARSKSAAEQGAGNEHELLPHHSVFCTAFGCGFEGLTTFKPGAMEE
jgi:hypothetical protein